MSHSNLALLWTDFGLYDEDSFPVAPPIVSSIVNIYAVSISISISISISGPDSLSSTISRVVTVSIPIPIGVSLVEGCLLCVSVGRQCPWQVSVVERRDDTNDWI